MSDELEEELRAPKQMEMVNDDRRDFQDLYMDLNKEFQNQGSLIQPKNLSVALAHRFMSFMGIDQEDAERVRVDINPFARKATITYLPSDGVSFQAVTKLADAKEFGIRLNIRF